MERKENPSLKKSEWALFVAIVFLIVSLLLISKWTSFRNLESIVRHEDTQPPLLLSIELTGCVQRPGSYKILQGSSIRMLMRKARLKPLADIEKITIDSAPVETLDRILEISCHVHVSQLEKISIEVRGCVEQNAYLCIPAGSRICDLKKFVELSSDADLAFLKRRRLLRNNEVIFIPQRRNEANSEDING